MQRRHHPFLHLNRIIYKDYGHDYDIYTSSTSVSFQVVRKKYPEERGGFTIMFLAVASVGRMKSSGTQETLT